MARPRVLLSTRTTKPLRRVYAIVVEDGDGFEGVVRVNTTEGTIAYVTDDPLIAPELLRMARAHYPHAYVATFTRAE